jgi:hypothetical protein
MLCDVRRRGEKFSKKCCICLIEHSTKPVVFCRSKPTNIFNLLTVCLSVRIEKNSENFFKGLFLDMEFCFHAIVGMVADLYLVNLSPGPDRRLVMAHYAQKKKIFFGFLVLCNFHLS